MKKLLTMLFTFALAVSLGMPVYAAAATPNSGNGAAQSGKKKHKKAKKMKKAKKGKKSKM